MLDVTRPGYCSVGQPISLYANFFKCEVSSATASIQKYSIEFTPPIADAQFKFRERVLRKVNNELLETVGRWVFANTALYSVQDAASANADTCSFTSVYDNTEYQITLRAVGTVNSSEFELRAFYNKFFNSVQGKLKLVMIGRKFYNPQRAIQLPQHKLTIWPGYVNSVGSYESGCLVNIDVSHRCLRTITVYDQLAELKGRPNQDFRLAFERLIIGATVLTPYNQKSYHIDEVKWDLTPMSEFSDRSGGSKTFKDYYSSRWSKNIAQLDQPLLLSKMKGVDCLLVPELCLISGLTDEIRADFNIMRDMANATKKEPQVRLRESAELVRLLKQNPDIQTEMAKWKATVDENAVSLEGHVLPSGDIVMGDNKRFRIGDNGSFDRDIQSKMLTQPKLSTWGIFFLESDKRLIDTFMGQLQPVIQTYKIQCDRPAMFPIASPRWNDWNAALRQNLRPGVQLIVCVLPGNRGKSLLYNDLKRTTFAELPVPSQVILNGTLKKDKGLRSVLNKVMMQINAKAGGIPWALNQLPLTDQPTMVVGIDIFHKRNAHSVLGFCATTDSGFARYVSVPKVNAPTEEISSKLTHCMATVLEEFHKENKVYPRRVIVFRDGVSDSQRSAVREAEVPQLQKAFSSLGETQPALVFIVVNKRINARFYSNQGGKVNNPPLGTCVDRAVVESKGYDYYLLPARATQGAMTPTHFHVLYDDSGVGCNELQVLSYRLCYGYYNWSGSIRVPAPCQYAHKLAYAYGERATTTGPPLPHGAWQSTRSLYFL